MDDNIQKLSVTLNHVCLCAEQLHVYYHYIILSIYYYIYCPHEVATIPSGSKMECVYLWLSQCLIWAHDTQDAP